MKRLLIPLLFISGSSFAAGPIYRHKEPEKQLEFENVYQDIRSVTRSTSTLTAGSSNYIQNTNTLQSGATMYVASGTVNNLTSTTLVAGTATITGFLRVQSNGSQLALGTLTAGNQILINAPQPVANAVYKIPDVGAAGDFLLTTGTQTVTGTLTTSWHRSGPGSTTVTSIGPSGDTNTGYVFPSADTIQEITSGAIVRAVSSAGEVTFPLQPSFHAYLNASAANVTGDNSNYNINFNSEVFDQGGDFLNSTFTAPVNGRYVLDVTCDLDQLSQANHSAVFVYIQTSNRAFAWQMSDIPTSVTRMSFHNGVVADMDANDTAYSRVVVEGVSKVVDVVGDPTATYFSGFLAQ